MMKPRLLDLFCGAGGAAMGYHRAGFEVVGVDNKSQPHYPFEFHQADALEHPLDGFDAYHASPPCQAYSKAVKHLSLPQPMLIDTVRDIFKETGKPYIIENVVGAPIPEQPTLDGILGVLLCGTSFGLKVYRHRLFETNFLVPRLPCCHREPAMNPYNADIGRKRMKEQGITKNLEGYWREHMGVGWMDQDEGREAIPPAYTEFIGRQLLNEIH